MNETPRTRAALDGLEDVRLRFQLTRGECIGLFTIIIADLMSAAEDEVRRPLERLIGDAIHGTDLNAVSRLLAAVIPEAELGALIVSLAKPVGGTH